ncbi:MAG: toll/interleukin-1 receptor domain-containing protein, partial [Clostridia bacterium]|nr:toll/interleukin-1 receptor domain-containing protein [Clostridia bacterium]
MTNFLYKTRGNSSPERKPRVYFTCHPEDFTKYFEKICKDIFATQDCAVFYTETMTEEIEEKYKESDLGQMNLFVIPVTFRLLREPNRAMDSDFRYAKEKHIPVLPIMMETGLDSFYSAKDKFGEAQYLSPYVQDMTAISYEEKLKKYLESVLISSEMAERIRKAFDAYIFLSYRKKDRHYANQLMKLIHSHPEFRDIAIWYDEFLTPGESFRANIEKMMQDSKLFTLLVTPNLLEYVDGKPNYVMAHEYPDAKKAGMDILPTEMEETDKAELRSKYEDIPVCVNPNEDELFKNRLLDSLSKIAIAANNADPEHNFLIGLAYLDGIDVEKNTERGIELITMAAEANLLEAMEKLFEMYREGKGIQVDYCKAAYWAERIWQYYKEKYGEEDNKTLTWM